MVRTALALKELAVVGHVIDAGEYFFEVPQPELLLFEIQYHCEVVLSHHTLAIALAQLAQELAEVRVGGQVHQDVLIFLTLLPVEAEQALLQSLLGLFVVLLTVIREHPYQVQCVAYQDSLYLLIEGARAAERW